MLSNNVAGKVYLSTSPRRFKNIFVVLQEQHGRVVSISLSEAETLKRLCQVNQGIFSLISCTDGNSIANSGGSVPDMTELAIAKRQVLRFFNCDITFTWDEAVWLTQALVKSDPSDRQKFLTAVLKCRRRTTGDIFKTKLGPCTR